MKLKLQLREMIRKEIQKLQEANEIKVGDKVKSAIYMYRGKTGKVIGTKKKKINNMMQTVAVVDFGDGKSVDHEMRRLKKI